jgi:hypothetical protein
MFLFFFKSRHGLIPGALLHREASRVLQTHIENRYRLIQTVSVFKTGKNHGKPVATVLGWIFKTEFLNPGSQRNNRCDFFFEAIRVPFKIRMSQMERAKQSRPRNSR